ncbi:hypothetical protein GGP65_003282 [Salinibacter ruber]|uniref:hypothetical protein n=1 Tax=Salinibacter ruber TaxID=146919 RepID=UPI002169C18D|nr:hypothetical protein [Salinibacter ruber]MCS3665638.1 hypothetical protein [Salinibacter ruber]
MEMTRGNRAIRDHQEDGKRLHLFEALGEGQVRYIGRATYLDHHWEDRPDAYGEMRSAIVFELAVDPTEDQDTDSVEKQVEEYGGSNQRWWTRPQDELRALALQNSEHLLYRSLPHQSQKKKRDSGVISGPKLYRSTSRNAQTGSARGVAKRHRSSLHRDDRT